MANSKRIAGLVGPTIIAITISETLNAHIWINNIAPAIHMNGALLFVAGLSIVRVHNLWVRNWPVVVTCTGWFILLLGLFRMFAPELQLQGAENTTMVISVTMLILVIGIFLTIKGYLREASNTVAG